MKSGHLPAQGSGVRHSVVETRVAGNRAIHETEEAQRQFNSPFWTDFLNLREVLKPASRTDTEQNDTSSAI